jgi:hypothetical protein
MVEQKGIGFLSAFVRRVLGSGMYPEAAFVFAGPGDSFYTDQLEGLKYEFPGRVGYWKGKVGGDLKDTVFLSGKCFTGFSTWEPGGISPMEALAFGVPGLVSDKQGHKSTIHTREEGDCNGARFGMYEWDVPATVEQALAQFDWMYRVWKERGSDPLWDTLVLNSLLSDNSWERSLRDIYDLFEYAVTGERNAFIDRSYPGLGDGGSRQQKLVDEVLGSKGAGLSTVAEDSAPSSNSLEARKFWFGRKIKIYRAGRHEADVTRYVFDNYNRFRYNRVIHISVMTIVDGRDRKSKLEDWVRVYRREFDASEEIKYAADRDIIVVSWKPENWGNGRPLSQQRPVYWQYVRSGKGGSLLLNDRPVDASGRIDLMKVLTLLFLIRFDHRKPFGADRFIDQLRNGTTYGDWGYLHLRRESLEFVLLLPKDVWGRFSRYQIPVPAPGPGALTAVPSARLAFEFRTTQEVFEGLGMDSKLRTAVSDLRKHNLVSSARGDSARCAQDIEAVAQESGPGPDWLVPFHGGGRR